MSSSISRRIMNRFITATIWISMPEDTTDLMLLNPVHQWDHVRGPADAAFTLVEYGDYECPDCGRLFGILQDLQQEFSTRLRLVYRHYPLSGIHKHAEMAAEAAEAAGAQGRFWEMHDLLFQHQDALERKNLASYGESLGLDRERFGRELKKRVYENRVRGFPPRRAKRRLQNPRSFPEWSAPRRRMGPRDS